MKFALHKESFPFVIVSCTLSSLFLVLHGDVHTVHPVCLAVVSLGSLLLEGPAQDPVLDSRGHIPRNGREGSILCGI